MVVGDMCRICLIFQECTFQFAEPGQRTVAGWSFTELPFIHLTRETGVCNVSACSPELAVAHSHPFSAALSGILCLASLMDLVSILYFCCV